MASTHNILLLGAGELGTAFLTQLSSLSATRITLGVRFPDKYSHLSSQNVTLKPLDLGAPSSELSEAFSHYDIIISATGFGQSPSTVLKLAEEILTAGKLRKARIERDGKTSTSDRLWFFPWQWGVDYDVIGDADGLMPLFGAQRSVRELLRSKAADHGVKWTVVSTGIFMSFLFEPFWGVVDRSREAGDGEIKVTALGDWEHGVSVTDVKDIARVLARIIQDEPADANDGVVYVAGDTVKYRELAEIVERASGMQVHREVWTKEVLKRELEADPDDGIKRYRVVFAGDGVSWPRNRTMNARLGINVVGVEEYARGLLGGK
ncbi:NAD(P)-binding protein [Corynespora cassiicola Philippines]|uniref:NAD(P)-binding protein n=1 Tax=Corynespora cassiicola Philippines TaxID=1448308 RepID=A0A2T2P727_CORCC|nr:NAD(P)-binding protein [Corynespora cassiicola Philippines]